MMKSPVSTVVLCLLPLLAGCAGTPDKIHVDLASATDLNPDDVNLPNPVQLHLFLLRSPATFTSTDYFQLADKEKKVLGADLLAQRDEVIRPGEKTSIDLAVPPGATCRSSSATSA